MDYFSLGSEISYPNYNALVYLLRKFKRLTSDLKLGNNVISSDYGTYSVTGGLTSVGGNFILEDTVTISSDDVLLNCFYTFHFTVVDVNLSGTVNRRVVSVTGDTGDDGVLEVVLEPSLLESDEVILPDFVVDIVFDEHEYYTPVSSLDITLTVDKEYITVGETATVTATVLDDTGSPVEDLELQFNFNGDVVTDVTDSDGIASAEYTGVGVGWVTVTVSGMSIQFFDGCMVATVTGNSITLGFSPFIWLDTTGDVLIDWGDGTSDTVNNPNSQLTHDYTDGESSHNIAFLGEVTSLGNSCFYECTGLTSIVIPDSVTSLGERCFYECTGLTSIVIPDSVTSLGKSCFYGCTGLTSVTIPDSVTSLGNFCFFMCAGLTIVTIPSSVTSIGDACFWGCTGLTSVTIPSSVTSIGDTCFKLCDNLIDYQLYWTGNNIIIYNSDTMPDNTNTIFTIPSGETANYTAKGYPTGKLVERGETLTLTCDKPIIQKTETSTITATLKDTGTPLTGKTLNYQVKHGNTVISSGTKTTNSSGQATISYTGTGVGDVDIVVSYGTLLQETYELLDAIFYDKAISSDYNSNWTNSDYTVSRDTTGTTIADNKTSGWTNYSSPYIPFPTTGKTIIEFDIVSYNGNVYFQLIDSTGPNFDSNLYNAAPYHVKMEITASTITRTVNNSSTTFTTSDYMDGTPFKFMFVQNTNGRWLKYKNFVIYSI